MKRLWLLGWADMAMAALIIVAVRSIGENLGAATLAVAMLGILAFNEIGVLTALRIACPDPGVSRLSSPGFRHQWNYFARGPEIALPFLGLAYFLALVTIGRAVLLMAPVSQLMLFALGVVIGSLLGCVQRHPYRTLAPVPVAGTSLLIALAWLCLGKQIDGPLILLGVSGGVLNLALRRRYEHVLPANARTHGLPVMNLGNYFFTIMLAVGAIFFLDMAPTPSFFAILTYLALPGVVLAWLTCYRAFFETILEMLIWPMSRVRTFGPGLAQVPERGGLLVIANHACWFDPMWLAKFLPRPVTPLMTSRFFDRWSLRWYVQGVMGAIRVPEANFRREAPELNETIRRLDRGECVIIFPEGRMRRKDEVPLSPFGQGVWRILHARPQTPVIACWIEGAWGSWASYRNGPPTVNKPLDIRRPIQMALDEPRTVPTEVLADQRATRRYLMQAVSNARRHLGLEPLSMVSE